MMMAYFPEDLLPLPTSILDKRMELYMAFIADDRLSVSDSVYLGRLN
jgi:hypothetical protein